MTDAKSRASAEGKVVYKLEDLKLARTRCNIISIFQRLNYGYVSTAYAEYLWAQDRSAGNS